MHKKREESKQVNRTLNSPSSVRETPSGKRSKVGEPESPLLASEHPEVQSSNACSSSAVKDPVLDAALMIKHDDKLIRVYTGFLSYALLIAFFFYFLLQLWSI